MLRVPKIDSVNRWVKLFTFAAWLTVGAGACANDNETTLAPGHNTFSTVVDVSADQGMLGTSPATRTSALPTTVSLAESGSSIWSVEVGNRRVAQIEVSTPAMTGLGGLSICVPADDCGAGQDVVDGDCWPLTLGGEDCLIVSSSGTRHVAHMLYGTATLAEARAGADLAEAAWRSGG